MISFRALCLSLFLIWRAPHTAGVPTTHSGPAEKGGAYQGGFHKLQQDLIHLLNTPSDSKDKSVLSSVVLIGVLSLLYRLYDMSCLLPMKRSAYLKAYRLQISLLLLVSLALLPWLKQTALSSTQQTSLLFFALVTYLSYSFYFYKQDYLSLYLYVQNEMTRTFEAYKKAMDDDSLLKTSSSSLTQDQKWRALYFKTPQTKGIAYNINNLPDNCHGSPTEDNEAVNAPLSQKQKQALATYIANSHDFFERMNHLYLFGRLSWLEKIDAALKKPESKIEAIKAPKLVKNTYQRLSKTNQKMLGWLINHPANKPNKERIGNTYQQDRLNQSNTEKEQKAVITLIKDELDEGLRFIEVANKQLEERDKKHCLKAPYPEGYDVVTSDMPKDPMDTYYPKSTPKEGTPTTVFDFEKERRLQSERLYAILHSVFLSRI